MNAMIIEVLEEQELLIKREDGSEFWTPVPTAVKVHVGPNNASYVRPVIPMCGHADCIRHRIEFHLN
jgi:hypothetical protein